MTPKLSTLTTQLVEKYFAAEDHPEATRLLAEECGNNLPFCNDSDEHQMERIRFAAIRVSVGYLDDLREAVKMAKTDWRDLLIWAAFAESLTAHQEWAERALKENPAPTVILLVGLTGSGKTTIGNLLAHELGWMFYEGDRFFSTENFVRFVHGNPVPEEAQLAAMEKLRELIGKYITKKKNLILASTALKESQRAALCVRNEVHLVYLQCAPRLLEERQKTRKAQLSNLERLSYQTSLFEPPREGLVIDANNPPQEIVAAIRKALKI